MGNGYCSSCGRTFGDPKRPPCLMCADQSTGYIIDRDRAIRQAHADLSHAMKQLDVAASAARNLGDDTYVDHLASIIRHLSDAREPLAEHLDYLAANP